MNTTKKEQKLTMPVILLLSLGAALSVILACLKYGPGLTHDSVAYLYAAQSLQDGEGLQYFGYLSPFIQWPPLYPMLLALLGAFEMPMTTAAIVINSLAAALIVFFTGRWLREKFSSVLLVIGGVLLVAVSVPLLNVSKYLWSEALFVLFFLLFFIHFERFLLRGHRRSLTLAAIFSALACLDRYAGVTVVASAAIFLLFQRKRLAARIFDILWYGVLSALPLGIWVIRNFIVSGTLLGVRLPSEFPLRLNIERTISAAASWIRPSETVAGLLGPLLLKGFELFALLLPALVMLVLLSVLARSLSDALYHRKLPFDLKKDGRRYLAIGFFLLFSAVYIIYLVASATSVAFEPINARYLVPIYMPMLLSVLTTGGILIERLEGIIGKRWTNVALAVLLFLAMLFPLANTIGTISEDITNGAGGYGTEAWQTREDFLISMQTSFQCTYYSNRADVVTVLSGKRTYSLPKKSGPAMYGLEQFKAAVARDPASMLVWFDEGVPGTLYSLEDLKTMYKLEEAGSFKGGKVYRILK